MISSPHSILSSAFTITAALVGLLVVQPLANGQTTVVRSDSKRVLIEPYTGPPIMLDEKRVVVPPTIVVRDTHTDNYSDGKPRIERQIARFSDDHRESDGFYREYYPDGKKFIDGLYRQGRQEGEWSYYYDNGQLNRTVTFQKGRLHGQWETFRADGTLAAKRSYENGLRHGTWQTYDDTGKQLLQEEHYVTGTPDGIVKAWFPDGKQRMQAGIKIGKRHGLTTTWDKDGKKTGEVTYVEGKLDGPAMIVLEDGTTKIQQYKNGLLISESKQ